MLPRSKLPVLDNGCVSMLQSPVYCTQTRTNGVSTAKFALHIGLAAVAVQASNWLITCEACTGNVQQCDAGMTFSGRPRHRHPCVLKRSLLLSNKSVGAKNVWLHYHRYAYRVITWTGLAAKKL